MAEKEFKQNFQRNFNMSFDSKNNNLEQMKKVIQTMKGKPKRSEARMRECLEYLK
jgi:mRNA-degrading endonuclease YafQ of YafQ-DinJ toxin-antitoxin module